MVNSIFKMETIFRESLLMGDLKEMVGLSKKMEVFMREYLKIMLQMV